MNFSLIMEVPESLVVDAQNPDGSYVLGSDLVYTIAQLNAVWPAVIVPGTHAIANKKLAHAVISTDAGDPLAMVNDLITLYSLQWVVMGLQPFAIEMVDDGTGTEIWVPRVDKPMDGGVFAYLDDRFTYDSNGNQTGTQTKALSWLHVYAGQDQWR